jgi:hypothetical protein
MTNAANGASISPRLSGFTDFVFFFVFLGEALHPIALAMTQRRFRQCQRPPGNARQPGAASTPFYPASCPDSNGLAILVEHKPPDRKSLRHETENRSD